MKRITIIAAALATAALATTYIQTSSTGVAPWKSVKDSVSRAHLADSALKADSSRAAWKADSARIAWFAHAATYADSSRITHRADSSAYADSSRASHISDSTKKIPGSTIYRYLMTQANGGVSAGSLIDSAGKLFSPESLVVGTQSSAATVGVNSRNSVITGFYMMDANKKRWGLTRGALSDSFLLRAYTPSEAIIDTPLAFGVSAGDSGRITRPFKFSSGLRVLGGIAGNAATATKLAAARTIGMSGDVTGAATAFDGTANITIPTTLPTLLTAGSAGSATSVPTLTWDAKGRLTAVGSAAISIPHTQISDWGTYISQPLLTTSSPTFATVTANLNGTASNANQLGGTSADNFVQGNGGPTWGVRTTNLTGSTALTQGLKSGFYDCDGSVSVGTPTGGWCHIIVNAHTNSTSGNQYQWELASGFWNGEIYSRTISPGVVSDWKTLIHSGNYPSFNNFSSGLTTTTLTASGSISEGGTALSSKYLGINASIPSSRISDWGTYINQPLLTTSSPTFATVTANLAGTASNSRLLNSQGGSVSSASNPSSWPISNGLYFNTVTYGQDYPSTYGNILSIRGEGSNQLFASWSQNNSGLGGLWFRNKRDIFDGWSPWQNVLDSYNYTSYNNFSSGLTTTTLTASGSISEGGTALSSKYLGIDSTASNASALGGVAASSYGTLTQDTAISKKVAHDTATVLRNSIANSASWIFRSSVNFVASSSAQVELLSFNIPTLNNYTISPTTIELVGYPCNGTPKIKLVINNDTVDVRSPSGSLLSIKYYIGSPIGECYVTINGVPDIFIISGHYTNPTIKIIGSNVGFDYREVM